MGDVPARLRERRSARVILLGPTDRILLIRFTVSRSDGPFTFWATPGGTVEDAESDRDAARRELLEELHLDLDLEGPVHQVTSVFEHMGEVITNTDVFFIAHCGSIAPKLDPHDPAERSAMREVRWWSTMEIDETAENVFPPDLASVVRNQTLR